MPTRFNTNYFRFKDDDEFEELIRDICALEWHDPTTKRYGRSGQSQKGIDVYGQPVWLDGSYYAAQCKLRPSQKPLTESEIEREVKEARDFPHPLAKLIIATDTPRDNHLQILVDKISERERSKGGFSVEIWFWPDIERRIATYSRVLVKYYHDHLTNLTNTDVLDRLVDRPLQVLSLKSFPTTDILPLERRLQFRGLQLVSDILSPVDVKAVSHSDLLPDGLLYQVNTADAHKENSSLLKFITNILSQEKLVEPACPIFIFSPLTLHNRLKARLSTLYERLDRFQWLTDDLPLDEVADRVFAGVFNYGYRRRGSIPTINISTRTRPNRPTSALLDLDWCSHLDTEHHPTETEWNELFVPALRTITTQLTGLKEATRIQVDSDLPIPASIALGFRLNLRMTIVGVWARQMGKSDVKHLWLSDSNPDGVEIGEIWYKNEAISTRRAILELTSGFSIHAPVASFIEQQKLTADIWLQLHLPTSKEGIEEAQAVAYTNSIGTFIRGLTERGITDFHLFLRLPTALGILLGQKLHACGRIHLYWFDNKNYSYKPAFMLA